MSQNIDAILASVGQIIKMKAYAEEKNITYPIKWNDDHYETVRYGFLWLSKKEILDEKQGWYADYHRYDTLEECLEKYSRGHEYKIVDKKPVRKSYVYIAMRGGKYTSEESIFFDTIEERDAFLDKVQEKYSDKFLVIR